ncbi:hypothetical protein C8Q78DRAFT_965284, partial [Trametes maxima]
LSRDLWPNNSGKMIQDNSTLATLPKHRVVPATYDDLCRWICVDPCAMDSATAVWLHPDVVGDDMRVELTVRLQGFIDEISLGMLGSTLEGAPKALQGLTLSSGQCHDAFEPQLRAISDIRQLVLQLLSRSGETRVPNDGKISLKRRVFERVSWLPFFQVNVKSVRVPLAEDPAGRLKRVENLWAIRHVVDAGEQRPDGKVVRVNPRVFRPGDFVDVAVSVIAVPMRVARGRRIVEVMFAPRTVVRLLSTEASMVRS